MSLNTCNGSSYAMRGIPCCPQTIACTSNHKFFPLYAPVYKKPYTINPCKYYIHENRNQSNVSVIKKFKDRIKREQVQDKYLDQEEERQHRQQNQQYKYSGTCSGC